MPAQTKSFFIVPIRLFEERSYQFRIRYLSQNFPVPFNPSEFSVWKRQRSFFSAPPSCQKIMSNKNNRTPFLDGALAIVKGAVCLVTGLSTGRSTKSVKFLVSESSQQEFFLWDWATEMFDACFELLRRITRQPSSSGHSQDLCQKHKLTKSEMLWMRKSVDS